MVEMKSLVPLFFFLSQSSLSFGDRVIYVPLTGYYKTHHNNSNESHDLVCTFHNDSPEQQALTVDYWEGYDDSGNTNTIDANSVPVTSTPMGGQTIAAGETYTLKWSSKTNSCPRRLRLTVKGNSGFLTGICMRNYHWSNPTGNTAQTITINQGKPF